MAQTTARATAGAATLRPLHDGLLVKRLPAQAETHSSSIVIPDSARERPQEGQVVAVGPGRVTEGGENPPLALKQGDRIFFSNYAGTVVKLDGEEYLIMKEEDVLGIIREEGRRA